MAVVNASPSPMPPLPPDHVSSSSAAVATTTPAASASSAASAAPPSSVPYSPAGLASKKKVVGRFLEDSSHVTYDVDSRLPEEGSPPQLEVSPITMYMSEKVLKPGRGIAVTRQYIAYALRNFNVRVLNTHTAQRALFKGHSQRITDVVFFSPDVDLLSTVDSNGLILVWRLREGSEGKPGIQQQLLLSAKLQGPWQGQREINPQLAWHPEMQDMLVVACDMFVVCIWISHATAGQAVSLDSPLQIPVGDATPPLPGVQVLSGHSAAISSLQLPHPACTLLPTPSEDGTVRVWGSSRSSLLRFQPHNGLPVTSASFLLPPHLSASSSSSSSSAAAVDQAVLLTGGPNNQQLRLWAPSPAQPSDHPGPVADSWHLIQTLDFVSSAAASKAASGGEGEEVQAGGSGGAFFNQMHVVYPLSLVLLANVNGKSIYTVHVKFEKGRVEGTRFQFLSEFAVTMPILSFTALFSAGSSRQESERIVGPLGGDGLGLGEEEERKEVVSIFCVQTQAIQSYSLPASLCIPPSLPSAIPTSSSLSSSPPSTTASVSSSATPAVAPDASDVTTASGEYSSSQGQESTDLQQEASSAASLASASSALHAAITSLPPPPTAALPIPLSIPSLVPLSQLPPPSAPPLTLEEVEAAQLASISQEASGAATSSLALSSSSSSSSSSSPAAAEVATSVQSLEMTALLPPLSPPTPVTAGLLLTPQQLTIASAQPTTVAAAAAPIGAVVEEGAKSEPLQLLTPMDIFSLVANSKPDSMPLPPPHNPPGTPPFPIPSLPPPAPSLLPPMPAVKGLVLSAADIEAEALAASSRQAEEAAAAAAAEAAEVAAAAAAAAAAGETPGGSAEVAEATGWASSEERGEVVEAEAKEEGKIVGDAVLVPSAAVRQNEKEVEKQDEVLSTVAATPPSLEAPAAEGAVRAEEMDESLAPVPAVPPTPCPTPVPTLVSAEEIPSPAAATAIAAAAAAALMTSSSSLNSDASSSIPTSSHRPPLSSSPALPTDASPSSLPPAPSSASLPLPSADVASSLEDMAREIAQLKESLAKLQEGQKDTAKQVAALVALPIAKEGKRVEAAVGLRMERAIKAHGEAAAARQLEDRTRREKEAARKEREQRSEMIEAVERAVASAVASAVAAAVESATAAAIKELQSSIPSAVEKHISAAVPKALQESVCSCFTQQVVPAVERSHSLMFQQTDSFLQRCFADISTSITQQQQLHASSNAALAASLQEALAETKTLSSTLVSVSQQLQGLHEKVRQAGSTAGEGGREGTAAALGSKPTNGVPPKEVLSLEHVEAALDPTKELSRLMRESQFENAFIRALSLADIAMVAWLCSQASPQVVLEGPLGGLSQGVLLSLVQQLGSDLANDTTLKLQWLRPAVMKLNPNDPQLGMHMKAILQQLYQNLHARYTTLQQQSAIAVSSSSLSSEVQLVMHIVNSILTTCK